VVVKKRAGDAYNTIQPVYGGCVEQLSGLDADHSSEICLTISTTVTSKCGATRTNGPSLIRLVGAQPFLRYMRLGLVLWSKIALFFL
jgi:hypothetical protein